MVLEISVNSGSSHGYLPDCIQATGHFVEIQCVPQDLINDKSILLEAISGHWIKDQLGKVPLSTILPYIYEMWHVGGTNCPMCHQILLLEEKIVDSGVVFNNDIDNLSMERRVNQININIFLTSVTAGISCCWFHEKYSCSGNFRDILMWLMAFYQNTCLSTEAALWYHNNMVKFLQNRNL